MTTVQAEALGSTEDRELAPSGKGRLFDTLFWKISLALVGLLVGLGSLQGFLSVYLWQRYQSEALQRSNWGIASRVAERVQPYVRKELNFAAVDNELYELFLGPRRFDVYLIDGNGRIEYHTRRADEPEAGRERVREAGGREPDRKRQGSDRVEDGGGG